MSQEDARFYEVVLDDCDGLKATLHVWSDGRIDRVHGNSYAVRTLLPHWSDDEAPAWVREKLRVRYPVYGPREP